MDVVKRFRVLPGEAVTQGEVLLAVSLNIANDFNTLPFSVIGEALRYHGDPFYLRLVVGD